MRNAWKFGVVALIALALVAVPGGGPFLNVLLVALSIAFFAAIAVLAYRLYREHRWTIEGLAPRLRLVLYGSVGVALLTFTATPTLFDEGGAGVVVWIALLALASYGVFWVYQQSRTLL